MYVKNRALARILNSINRSYLEKKTYHKFMHVLLNINVNLIYVIDVVHEANEIANLVPHENQSLIDYVT